MLHQLETLDASRFAGVVQITTFNCGCDAMMIELLREVAKKRRLPYLVLVVDEHTAEVGAQTRLEAFVDSLAFVGGGQGVGHA